MADSVARVFRWIYLGVLAALAYRIMDTVDNIAVALFLVIFLFFVGVGFDLAIKQITGEYGEEPELPE